ncbi:NAD(P)-binding protein [Xylariaceae sp. FL0662B]|nr:NAD(P)-binding protein [Xylariaceae sp. FL0662B]
MELTGCAFVTGGGSGISRAVCMAFAKCGVRGLFVADLNFKAAAETALECEAVATNPDFHSDAIQIDVAIPDSVQSAMNKMVDVFGRIDYCVNGAGVVGEMKDIAESGLDSFRRTMDINIQGTFLVMKAASAAMASQEPLVIDATMPARGLTRGTIVNVASIASSIAMPKAVQYVASKHAVVGLTKSAAMDNIKHNIRVNCVSPSWVDTPMVQEFMSEFPESAGFMMSCLPMGRLGLPEEIADLIVFLCSPRASWINGTNITIDGAVTVGLFDSSSLAKDVQ